MGPLPPMQHGQDPRLQGPPPPGMSYAQNKRLAPGAHPAESPAKKKQSKWSAEEDAAIIELRGNGMKWEDISRNLPGRSAISCRLRFQNYLERRSEWDEEKKNKLARLYERFKKDMWEKIAKEMALPWRAAEAMHWQIGEVEMANRANVPVFHLAGYSPSQPTPSYGAVASASAPVSTGARSEESGSPRSATGSYMPGQGEPGRDPRYEQQLPPAPQQQQQPMASGQPEARSNSDFSSTGGGTSQDAGGRRSPQYLAPLGKAEEGGAGAPGTDGRRSPRAAAPQ